MTIEEKWAHMEHVMRWPNRAEMGRQIDAVEEMNEVLTEEKAAARDFALASYDDAREAAPCDDGKMRKGRALPLFSPCVCHGGSRMCVKARRAAIEALGEDAP